MGGAAGPTYVFGYASLVALAEPGALPGRLRGYCRRWGVAMDNWEGGEETKHWLDRETGERPRIRVAYLDVVPDELEGEAAADGASTVNGLALPVDAERLAAFDKREINYRRVDVTGAFEPAGTQSRPSRVFTYVGLDAARARCRRALADGNGFVARDYLASVRAAFAALGEDALAEFDRTTDPAPFPLADLRVVNAPPAT